MTIFEPHHEKSPPHIRKPRLVMEGPKDDLKWFGEGFDGFPKRLPDDCVEYMLFIIDSALTQKQLLARLELVRKDAIKIRDSLLKEYIWQRDEFNLKIEVDNQNGMRSCDSAMFPG
jgi:hypothetical protein